MIGVSDIEYEKTTDIVEYVGLMFAQEVGRHCYRRSHLADNSFIL